MAPFLFVIKQIKVPFNRNGLLSKQKTQKSQSHQYTSMYIIMEIKEFIFLVLDIGIVHFIPKRGRGFLYNKHSKACKR
jgi:hypothetical protein